MSKDDWRTVGYIGVALSIIFLIGGFITYYYAQSIYVVGYYAGTDYPYRNYSVGFLVSGFAIAVIGGGALWRAGIEARKSAYITEPSTPSPPEVTQSAPRKYCRYCGADIRSDAVFCEKCGKRLT
jgi:hypothetical protein